MSSAVSNQAKRAIEVTVASRLYAVPLECPCCGAQPDTEVTVPIARSARAHAAADSAHAAAFPYCRSCVDHAQRWESAGLLSAGLIVVGVVASAVIGGVEGVPLGVATAVVVITIAAALAAARRRQARRAMRESCSAPSKAVEFLGWSGTASSFRFESITYAAKFAEQNADRLVENSHVRKLLDRYKLARIAVPTPAAAMATLPPPPDVSAWIERIAKTRGRVARRTAVTHALDALHEPGEREQLVTAIAAKEVAALLDQVEGLTPAERKVRLSKLVEWVRRDNIPEPLQREMMRALEAHVGEGNAKP